VPTSDNPPLTLVSCSGGRDALTRRFGWVASVETPFGQDPRDIERWAVHPRSYILRSTDSRADPFGRRSRAEPFNLGPPAIVPLSREGILSEKTYGSGSWHEQRSGRCDMLKGAGSPSAIKPILHWRCSTLLPPTPWHSAAYATGRHGGVKPVQI
jgi:hypothetical protein